MTVYLVDEAHFEIAADYAEMDKGARLVLLQDAVYASIAGKLRGKAYALEDDVARRGLKGRIPPSVQIIGYLDLVQMMEKERVVNFL